MLLSKKKRYIYIHIPKTAGVSVKNALLPLSVNNLQLLLWHVSKHIKFAGVLSSQKFPTHIVASDLIGLIGRDVFDSYFSFAFVRNPWDWLVSLYKYMLKSADHPKHSFVKGLGTFDEFIRWRCARQIRLQKDFICSKDGKQLVDFVGRFERIDEDFQRICFKIGISTSLPKLNISNTKPYREFYTDETRDLVMSAYHPDITFFNYNF